MKKQDAQKLVMPKSTDELKAMIARPNDWHPSVVVAAQQELRNRCAEPKLELEVPRRQSTWIERLTDATQSLPVTEIPADRGKPVRLHEHPVALRACAKHVEEHYKSDFHESPESFTLERKLEKSSAQYRYSCIAGKELLLIFGFGYSSDQVTEAKHGENAYSIICFYYAAGEDDGGRTCYQW